MDGGSRRLGRGVSLIALGAALAGTTAAAQTAAILRASQGLATPVITPAATLPPVAPVAPSAALMTSASARAIANQAAVSNAVNIATQANAAARATAAALAQTVRNGLVAGGLVPVANPTTAALDPTGLKTWQGASAPVQTGTADSPTVTITQTDLRALLTWESFNVGRATTLQFVQNPDQVVVNRIVGNIDPLTGQLADGASLRPSQILGTIKAAGTVVVLNQNGIMFGATSQVNVRSLVASSLELGGRLSGVGAVPATLQQRSTAFLQNGLLGGPELLSSIGVVVNGVVQDGAQREGEVAVAAGAAITAASGGFVIIAAPRVTNAGALAAPEGQVSLQAGRQIVATASTGAADSADPNIRGLILSSSSFPAGAAGEERVVNAATGIISAPRGYVSLGTSFNGSVDVAGVLTSTTSVSRNGKIALSGATVAVAPGTVIAITPDTGTDTIPQGSASVAAFKRSVISIGGADTVNRTTPSAISIGAGALIYAPSGNVSVGAVNDAAVRSEAEDGAQPSSVLVDSGATIDVGGIKDFVVAASRNSIAITPVKRNELRDTPNYREPTTDGSFTLNGATVFVDPRLSGVRADGVAWVGSPLIEAGSYYAQVGITAAELMTSGGSITLGTRLAATGGPLSPSVKVKPGALLDVSGGWVRYEAGVVKTTRLLTSDGRIVEIGRADPNDNFVGIVDVITADQARFGLSTSFDNPAFQEFGYETGYTEGRDAGAVTIKSSLARLDGALHAEAFAGTQQIARAREGSASSGIARDLRQLQGSPADLPNGGLLKITGFGAAAATGGADITVYHGTRAATSTPEFAFSDSFLSSAGLASVVLQTSGAVNFLAGTDVMLAPNGALVVDAGRSIRFDGTVTVPSGTIVAQTYDDQFGSVFSTADDKPASVLDGSPTPHLFDLTVTGTLSTRGRWSNDLLVTDGAYLGSTYTDGGSISLTVAPRILVPIVPDTGGDPVYAADLSGSLDIAAGARLDVSAGGYVRPTGALTLTARGGNVSLTNATTYFALTGTLPVFRESSERIIGVDAPGFLTSPTAPRLSALSPRVAESRVSIAADTIFGQGFAGGGNFQLTAPDIAVGSSPGGPTATALSLDFFNSSGFGSYALTTYHTELRDNVFSNGLVGNTAILKTETVRIAAGETLNLTQALIPSLLNDGQSTAARALATGGNIGALLGHAVPVDAWDRRPVNLTLGGLTELDIDAGGTVTGSDGVTLTASKILNAGTIRLAGGRVAVSDLLPSAYQNVERAAIGVADLAQIFGPADADGRFDENAPNALGIAVANIPGSPVLGNADLVTLSGSNRLVYLTGALAQGEGIRLVAGSVTDLSGVSIRDPRAGARPNGGEQKITGRIVDGGTLETLASFVPSAFFAPTPLFGPNPYLPPQSDTPIRTQRGSVTLNALAGSRIDLRGASDAYDLETSLGVFQPAPVWSNGGRLTLSGGGTINAATILARGGAPKATGGILTWLDPVLAQTVADVTAGDAAAPGTVTNLVSADQIAATGFDTFVAQDRLTTAGNATLRLGRGFYLTARTFAGDQNNFARYDASLATTGNLSISAPYIQLSSPQQRVDIPLFPIEGSGTVTLSASTIDIFGAIYAETSVSQLTMNATGDVRLSGVEPASRTLGNSVIEASSLGGELIVHGNLTINAAQLYPTTGTGSLQQDINAVRAGGAQTARPFVLGSLGETATIRIGRPAGSVGTTPYSAGGNLTIQAANIVQAGTVRVPLGRLTLGSTTPLLIDADFIDPVVLPATQSLILGEGSITSVSADGLKIPYGTTTDLIEYFFSPTSDGRIFAPPAAEVRLGGGTITVAANATVDARGGGDLYAYEFAPGVGGSRDILSRFNSDAFSSRNGLQYPDGRQVYAIVPSLQGVPLAPIDPLYSADYANLYGPSDAGRSVYLEAAPGLAAGWYTLLPAQYAELPGGFRVVENVGAAVPAVGVSAKLRDGTVVVGGYFGVPAAGFESSQRRSFTVSDQATIKKFSNITLTSATTTFSNLATRDKLTVPQVPSDAARLVLNPLAELNIAATSKFLTTPATGGRGAQVDLSGTAIAIVDGDAVPATAGVVTVRASDLNNLNAASLLIGGQRTDRADGTTLLSPTATSILLANSDATALTAPEVVLVVDGLDSSIVIAGGAAIRPGATLSDTRSGNYTIVTAADGATGIGSLLRVANGPERLVDRTGPLAVPNSLSQSTLAIGEATLVGTSILLSSSRDLTITDSPSTTEGPVITARNLALEGDDIFFTAAPSGYRGLTVTSRLEAQFAGADRLTLTSDSIIGFSNGEHRFNDLIVDARGLRPYGHATTPPPSPRDDQVDTFVDGPLAVTIVARDFSFRNSDVARGACSATATVNGCGDGGPEGTAGNSVAILTRSIHLGSGPMAIYGADRSVTLSATQGVYAEGEGSLDLGKAALTINTPYFGDRTLIADPRGTKVQPILDVATTGSVVLANPDALAAPTVAEAPGATIRFGTGAAPVASFTATDVIVRASAGVLDVRSTGDIRLAGGTVLATPGYAKDFGDAADRVTVSAPGGALTLVSANGDVDLGSGTRVSVGGGKGAAGTLQLSAASGSLLLGGAIDANAPDGRASLTLNSGSALDLAALLAGPGAAFTGDINIRTGSGDLDLATGQVLRATSVRLSADGGRVDIAGTIDTSGINGGDIGLFGTGGVTLASTALLDAHAEGYAATDTRNASGGDIVIGTAGSGDIVVASGARIDVAARRPGARLVAQTSKDPVTFNDRLTYNYAQSDIGGTVLFRAPLIGSTVAIDYAGSTSGARDVGVEAYRVFDLALLAGVADCSVAADICVDPAGRALLDLNAVPGSNRLGDLVAGGIPEFVRSFSLSTAGLGSLATDPNFHARPGVELAFTGDIVLKSNWNFAAGVVDVAGATAAGLMQPSQVLGNGLSYVVPGSEAAIFNDYTDFLYRTGGKALGEAGVITFRAGGNLDIQGSITDGFFTFADQTDPRYISYQLGGGPQKVAPALVVNCGTDSGDCSSLGTPFVFNPTPGALANPAADSVNISINSLVKGNNIPAEAAPYNAAANRPGALGARPDGSGDPIGSAQLLPLLADGTPAASSSYRLVAGALLDSADPAGVAATGPGTVTISGEASYRAVPVAGVRSYFGPLELYNVGIGSGPFSTPPGGSALVNPTQYVRFNFASSDPLRRAYFRTRFADFITANDIASDQYQYFNVGAQGPAFVGSSYGLITRFLDSIAEDFGARVRAGDFGYTAPGKDVLRPLDNATIYTRTLVRTGTGSITVAAADAVDLTNGPAKYRNVFDRPGVAGNPGSAQVGGTAIYTAGHVVDRAATVALADGQSLIVTPGSAPLPVTAANFDAPNLQGVLANEPVYAGGGGGISVSAGTDILARRDAWSESFRNVPYANAGTDTQQWRVTGSTEVRINPQLFSTGIGALAGGDVAVSAGGRISQLTIAADTTRTLADVTVPGTDVPAPVILGYGGGNVAVRAGDDILGGQVDVASGVATVASAGAIASAGNIRVAATFGSPTAKPEANLLSLRLDDATIAVSALRDITVGGIASIDGLGYYSAAAGVAFTTNGDFALTNNGKGNATPLFNSSNTVAVLPGSLRVAALFGDIDLAVKADGVARRQVVLAPSSLGQLGLFAGGDLVSVTLSMDDSDPSLLPGPLSVRARTFEEIVASFGFPSVLPNTSDAQRRLLHNQRITHAGDTQPVRIFADGDIAAVSLAVPKQARIGAGGDIVDMIFIGQNLAPTDITRITAGRDIVATSRVVPVPTATGSANLPTLQGNSFVLGGPGTLQVEAGRDLGPFLNSATVRDPATLGIISYAGGLITVGNDFNPWLGSAGANIVAQFGVAKGADYTALRDYYIDPANVGALDGDLFEQITDANGNKFPDRTRPIYAPILVGWLKANTGVTYPDAAAAYAAFLTLPPLLQQQFLLDKVYFNELAAPSRPSGPSYLQYVRGYRAVDLLFPGSRGYTANDLTGAANGGTEVPTGNLDLRLAALEAQRGGNITILGPGGRVLGGSVVATQTQAARRGEEVSSLNLFQGLRRSADQATVSAAQILSIPIGFEGVLTLRGGAVNGFTDGDFLLNQSRLFTVQGGDVTLWSSNGDLNAGQGAKTSASNPPVVVRFNPDGFGVLDQAGSIAGAGIAALPPSDPATAAPSVTLVAPAGTVDAGDAGVRAAGNVFVAAAQIANADNFKVGGTAFGIGAAGSVDLGAAASANAASAAAAQAAAAVNPTGSRNSDDRSRISVEVLGFGGDPADDPCNKAVDQRPANCPVARP